jgi:hypothetical protein
MHKLPAGGKVVLAVDHDAGGDKIGARIEAIFERLGRPDLALLRDSPMTPGKDWNDELRAPKRAAGPPMVYRPKFANR